MGVARHRRGAEWGVVAGGKGVRAPWGAAAIGVVWHGPWVVQWCTWLCWGAKSLGSKKVPRQLNGLRRFPHISNTMDALNTTATVPGAPTLASLGKMKVDVLKQMCKVALRPTAAISRSHGPR
jgi:hypothetical protein